MELTKSDVIEVINQCLKEVGLRPRTVYGIDPKQPQISKEERTGKVIINGWEKASETVRLIKEIEADVVEGIKAVAKAKHIKIEVILL